MKIGKLLTVLTVVGSMSAWGATAEEVPQRGLIMVIRGPESCLEDSTVSHEWLIEMLSGQKGSFFNSYSALMGQSLDHHPGPITVFHNSGPLTIFHHSDLIMEAARVSDAWVNVHLNERRSFVLCSGDLINEDQRDSRIIFEPTATLVMPLPSSGNQSFLGFSAYQPLGLDVMFGIGEEFALLNEGRPRIFIGEPTPPQPDLSAFMDSNLTVTISPSRGSNRG